jgi:hypothetical protein
MQAEVSETACNAVRGRVWSTAALIVTFFPVFESIMRLADAPRPYDSRRQARCESANTRSPLPYGTGFFQQDWKETSPAIVIVGWLIDVDVPDPVVLS